MTAAVPGGAALHSPDTSQISELANRPLHYELCIMNYALKYVLLLMEYGLGQEVGPRLLHVLQQVLILLLMEYGLGQLFFQFVDYQHVKGRF